MLKLKKRRASRPAVSDFCGNNIAFAIIQRPRSLAGNSRYDVPKNKSAMPTPCANNNKKEGVSRLEFQIVGKTYIQPHGRVTS